MATDQGKRLRSRKLLPLILAAASVACSPGGPKPLFQGRFDTATASSPRQLEAGTLHIFEGELTRGEAIHLEIQQDEVDVEIRIRDLTSRIVTYIDTPTGREASEKACYVAENTGPYRIEISAFDGTGGYTFEPRLTGQASPQDLACVEGFKLFREATQAATAAESVDLVKKAAEQFEKAGELFHAGLALREAASTWLNAAAPAKAIEEFQRALDSARVARSSYLQISVLSRLGLACRDFGDLECAVNSLQEALLKARESQNLFGVASALTNLGQLAPDLGAPHRALDQLDEAIEIWKQLRQPGEQAQALIARATALGLLDRHEEADDALEEALALAEQTEDSLRRASALLVRGWNFHLRGQPAAGVVDLTKALEIYRSLGMPNAEAGALDRRGTMLAAAGNPVAAAIDLKAALDLLDEHRNPKDRATAASNLGCNSAEIGEIEQAEQWIAIAQEYYEESDDPATKANIKYCEARLAHLRGELDLATAHAEEALALINRLRAEARGVGHAFRPILFWRNYSDLAIDLRLERFSRMADETDLNIAFEILDQARAWSLFEQVVARYHQLPPQSDKDQGLKKLQTQLNLLAVTRDGLLQRNETSARLTQVEADLRRKTLEIESIRAERRRAEHLAGRLGSPYPASLLEVQGRLQPDSALLAFRLSLNRSDLFVVTRERIAVHQLESRADLERHAEAFYRSLESSRSDDNQWHLLAEVLGPKLLAPGVIPSDVDKLLVMADGMLHYVPFAALSSPRLTPRSGLRPRQVLDDFSITYVPSASVWLALEDRNAKREPAPKAIAIFADPVFSDEDERFSSQLPETQAASNSRGIRVRRLPVGPLPRLPYSGLEAQALLSLVGEDSQACWTGFQATKSAVLESDLSDFRILHFATHAAIDESLPALSGLVLSRLDDQGQSIDGELRLHEIQELRFGASLTVLSGCQTALGKHVQGNGLLGLTHGFFNAGSSQVLVSLWSVDDQATSLLMAEFYEEMLSGQLSSPEALRQAQLWLRSQSGFEAPLFWAPFALHGPH